MLRVVCPFIPRRIQDATRESLFRLAPQCDFVDVTGRDPLDDYGYGHLIADLWRTGEDFALIEHDIVIHEGVVPGFERCPKEWCNHAYGMGLGGRMWDGIGCVRFRGTLTRRMPWLADFYALTTWKGLDQAVFNGLSDHGLFGAHHHWPMVGHSHSHGDHTADLHPVPPRRGPPEVQRKVVEPRAVLPDRAPRMALTRLRPDTEEQGVV